MSVKCQLPMAPKITLAGFFNFDITPFGTFVRVTFNSTHPVIPVVSVGRSKPTVTTSTGVDFEKTQIVSSTFPLLAGPRTEHDVIVGPASAKLGALPVVQGNGPPLFHEKIQDKAPPA
jgi:hypothetical protein